MTTSVAFPLRATAALRKSPIPALRNLWVEETDGLVTLRGLVGSYYLKQLAQETVMAALDGRVLSNQIMVHV
jgi:hypothetical protein